MKDYKENGKVYEITLENLPGLEPEIIAGM